MMLMRVAIDGFAFGRVSPGGAAPAPRADRGVPVYPLSDRRVSRIVR
jgi:hypothetical protein